MPNEQQCYPALPVTDPAPTVVHVQTQQAPAPQVIVVGGCPSCRVSELHMFNVSHNAVIYSSIFICRSVCYVPVI